MGTLLHRHGIFGASGAVPAAVPFFSGDLGTRPFYPQASWPAAIYHAASDKTFMTWETETLPNSVKVAEYDHATSTFTNIVTVDSHMLENDDHGMPVLEVLSDGRLVCFYGSHSGTEDDQQWSISDQSGGSPDISNWTRQTALTAASYTYPKPVNVAGVGGAGTLYLLTRDFIGGNGSLVIQSATYTSGGAVSFGAKTTLFDPDDGAGGRVYAAEFHLDGSGNIEIAATWANSGDTIRRHVYFFRYMTATGALENFDGSTSTASGSLPINLTTANASYRIKDSGSNQTGTVSFCRDSNGYAHLLYGDDATGLADDPIDVKHQYHNGTAWSAETTLFQARDRTPVGSAMTVWALVPGASGTVQAWYGDGNTGSHSIDSDTIKRRVWNGSTWGAAQTMLPIDTLPQGPVSAVRNADPDLRVIASNGADTVTDLDAEYVKKYAHGDGGFLSGPTLNDPFIYQTCLLLNCNGADGATSTSDLSSWGHLHPVTFHGNAQLDTAQKKFGTASLLLDGTGDYLTIPHSRENQIFLGSEFRLTNDTIEFFWRPNEVGRAQYLISTREGVSGDNFGFAILQEPTGNAIRFFAWDGLNTLNLTASTSLSVGNWYHVAVQRNGDTINIYLDGILDGTGSLSGASVTPSEGTTLHIGRDSTNATRDANGWIDSIRWTKRVLRDVSTVPTTEFPVD